MQPPQGQMMHPLERQMQEPQPQMMQAPQGHMMADGLLYIQTNDIKNCIIHYHRARYLTLTQGSFTAGQAERWGAVAEVLPLDQVLPRAQELVESMTAKPQLLSRYLAITVRQRLSRRMAEAYQLGSALEGLTGADLAYQQH